MGTKPLGSLARKFSRIGLLVAAFSLLGGITAASASSPAQVPTGRTLGGIAAASDSSPVQVPIQRINLHSAYLRALPKAKHGLLEKMPLRGNRPAQTHAAANACTEPECPVSYQGGPVQHNPTVYLLLWGPSWGTTELSAARYLYLFYSGLGASGDNWSPITSQYGDSSGNPTFTGGTYGVLHVIGNDWTVPPATVTEQDLNAEADAFTSMEGITDKIDAQIVIVTQSGTCFSDGWGGQPTSCATHPAPSYCAWHTASFLGETFTNLPFQPDGASIGRCGTNEVNPGSAGLYDGFSIAGGHEYAETISDPDITAWYDTTGWTTGFEEIGDKCFQYVGDVKLSTGTFAMQRLWSNAAFTASNNTQGCSMTAP